MSATVVIVPCYNEAERLDKTAFVDFARENPGFKFIFVDDGSSDRTADVLDQLHSILPEQLHHLKLASNAGKAAAVRSGVQSALESDAHEYFAFLDADLAAPLSQLILLQNAMGADGTTAVIGSRVKRLGARILRDTPRHYLGRVFATAVSAMLDLGVYDSQCGIKMFNRNSATLAFGEPFHTRWLFDVEILIRLRDKLPDFDTSVSELPLGEWTEKQGSKITFGSFLRMPRDLLKIRRIYSSEIQSSRLNASSSQRSA